MKVKTICLISIGRIYKTIITKATFDNIKDRYASACQNFKSLQWPIIVLKNNRCFFKKTKRLRCWKQAL